jgi:hypothetical protein
VTGALRCGDQAQSARAAFTQHGRDIANRALFWASASTCQNNRGGPWTWKNEDNHDELKRQLGEAAQILNPAERELWAAMQKFIDQQAKAGGSRDRAIAIVRNFLRKASDMKALQRRASSRLSIKAIPPMAAPSPDSRFPAVDV